MVGQRPNQAFAALQIAAGRYAGRVARLWPAPYDGYYALPMARRHLAHICMPRIGRVIGLDDHAFVREIVALKVREFLKRWAPDAPRGLETVLAKLEVAAWEPTFYRRLLGLMAQSPAALKTLRHAPVVTRGLLEALELMPERLRGPSTMRWIGDAWLARLACEAMALAHHLRADGRGGEREGGRGDDALVERLSRATSRERFFAMLVDELRPTELIAPVVETELLRPLRTVEDVKDAGLRFRNCLGDCVHEAVFGTSAFVEWRGDEPAVMELAHEGAAGWRLVTLLGVANRQLSTMTQRKVRDALQAQGARTGVGAQHLFAELESVQRIEREIGRAHV